MEWCAPAMFGIDSALTKAEGKTVMSKSKYISEAATRRGRRKKPGVPLDLERIHQRNGYFDGKIFYAPDRATYTFLYDDQVMVLHFDLSRRALYLKGHKIQSLDDHPQLEQMLSVFKDCLSQNPKTKDFVKFFDECVAAL